MRCAWPGGGSGWQPLRCLSPPWAGRGVRVGHQMGGSGGGGGEHSWPGARARVCVGTYVLRVCVCQQMLESTIVCQLRVTVCVPTCKCAYKEGQS